MSRIGIFLDRGSEQFVVKSRYLSTYQGLLESEASLPDYVMKPRIQAPKTTSSRTDGFVKRKERRKFELEEVSKQLEDEKKPKEPPKPLRFLHKIEKPVPRPPTPSVEEPDEVGFLLVSVLMLSHHTHLMMANIACNDKCDGVESFTSVFFELPRF